MTIPTFSLKERVALITGARRGIGRRFALTFAEAGADVALVDYIDEGGELDEVRNSIEALGRKATTTKADITIKADVEQMVKTTVDTFGTIDILVNNAGIGCPGRALDISEELWDRVIDTHVKGCLLCSQAVAKIMIPRRTGNIINMASIAGLTADNPSGSAYDVAKAGVIMLTRALSRELAPYNIRVNAICPYVIETNMTQRYYNNPELEATVLARAPLGRLGRTDDLVGAAIFLASDASSWVTGHPLVIDGGFLA